MANTREVQEGSDGAGQLQAPASCAAAGDRDYRQTQESRLFASTRKNTFGQLASTVAMVLSILLVGEIFHVGFEKNLVGTIGQEAWGRHIFGFGAALTQSRWGIGGYVVDSAIEERLQNEGLTDFPAILRYFGITYPDNLRDERLMQKALEQARDFDTTPPQNGYQRLRGSHGDDVGIATFTILSFTLFGVKVSSLYYTYFVLLCFTIILFVLSHYRSRVAMASLALLVLALYVLATSDLVNFTREIGPHRGAVGIDFKDPRFFGTLAAIPALHMLLTWIRPHYEISKLHYLLLIGQASVLALVINVRGPVLWLIFALCIYWILCIARRRTPHHLRELCRWRSARSFFPTGTFALFVGGGIIVSAMAAHPVYRIDGDLVHHPLWHNVMISLEMNPEWKAKYLPSVNGTEVDEMPREIAKQAIAKLPPDQRSQYLARGGWPTPSAVMLFARERFFDILRNDPSFVLHTFTIDLPKLIFLTASGFYLTLLQVGSLTVLITVVTLGVIVWVARQDPDAPIVLPPLVRAVGSFSLIALLPCFIGPPRPLIMIDHFLWFLFFLCLLACYVGVRLVAGLQTAAAASEPPSGAMIQL